MAEAVRLVIWDLDETFWKGTITEGGIREYVQEHHDVVLELARRGILSSICSKNDPTQIIPILEEKGILEYFVFNSISWEPKGERIAALVESVQLRAPTVMFVDDNPSNRAEALDRVPGLQVESDQFISKMLADPRFSGKDDRDLSRLNQYRLLESRKRDEKQSSGGNEDFLRSCNIRVHIEFDVLPHLDRAIELINRTNQLNYTKKRLPENIEQARKVLSEYLANAFRQAGLVRVVDKYGDYGFVGFFVVEYLRDIISEGDANSRLLHYCFSCRTLGMLIEQFTYQYLRRPQLDVVEDVLTDLKIPREIDWVTLVPTLGIVEERRPQIAPEIVVWGGCEAEAVGFYLSNCTQKLRVFGNYASNGMFSRMNSALQALETCNRNASEFLAEAQALGLPPQIMSKDFMADAAPGTVFVFNCSRDAGPAHYYHHKECGWLLHFEIRTFASANLVTEDEQKIADAIERSTSLDAEQRLELARACRHIRKKYAIFRPDDAFRAQAIRDLIARVPLGAKVVLVVDHDEVRLNATRIDKVPLLTSYAKAMCDLAADLPYVGVVTFTEVIESAKEIQVGGNHYDRPVYHRLACRVIEVIDTLSCKSEKGAALSRKSAAA